MNILYIDPVVHSKTSETYQYYNGLFDSLSKFNKCTLYSGRVTDIKDLIVGKIPEVIVFGLGYGEFGKIKNLEEIDIPKVGFVFKPQNFLEEKMAFFTNNDFDLLFTSLPDKERYEKLSGVTCKRFCYAADPNIFHDRGIRKKYDIGFSGALHQNKIYVDGAFSSVDVRRVIQNELSVRSDIQCFLNGSDLIDPRIKSYEEYARRISESESWFATPAAFGDITPRYFEVVMSGTTLICSEVHDEYKDIFRDGETCISFKEDGSDFMKKFEHYRNNKDEFGCMHINAAKEFKAKHSWEARADDFLTHLKNLFV